MTLSRLTLAVTFVVVAMPSLALAATERLAFSDKLGVEVFALPDASGAWCRKDMTLELRLKNNSPLVSDGVEGFIPRLSPVFDDKCPQAATASVMAVKGAVNASFGKALTARKADGWKAAPVQETVAKADTKSALSQPAPEAAPKAPAAAEPAPAPTPLPAPVAAPALVQKTSAKPLRDVAVDATFSKFFLAYVAAQDTALDDKAFLDFGARLTACQDYLKVSDNEFRYDGFLKEVALKLAEEGKKTSGFYYRTVSRSQFKSYDPAKQSFEFRPLSEDGIIYSSDVYWKCNTSSKSPSVPVKFQITWDGAATINGLPMSQTQGDAYLNKRGNRFDQRTVYVEVIYSLKDVRKVYDRLGPITAQLHEATVYEDNNLTRPLHVYSRDELAAMAKTLADEKLAEAAKRQQQQEAAQKERQAIEDRYSASRDYNFLQSASPAQRVAYLHSGARGLSVTGPAIAQSLVTGKSIPSVFLIQADGSGAKDIETKWPGRLVLTLDPGLPELKSGNWYVVSGDLRADGDDKTLKDKPAIGQLAVKAMTACEKDRCAESEDVAAMIAKRYPEANVTASDAPATTN